MVVVSTSLPVLSTTATLTPVRMPGSRPKTARWPAGAASSRRSEEHTSELQSQSNLVCRLLLEKKKQKRKPHTPLTRFCCFFFFNDTATTEIYTLSLHDALPISSQSRRGSCG